jgi:aminopeptidase YwaD
MQNLDRFAQLFSQEFSGLRAKRTVGQLTQLHRIQASPGLLAAVELTRQAAEAAGLARVQVHRYPLDGKGYWWTWKKPWFWSPQSAELRLMAPEEEVLARFEDEPCHLGTVCAPTPPGGITAEVVDVGQGLTEEDYEGKDVAGKAVLVSGAGWGYRASTKMAALHGAVGVITDSITEVPPARTRENEPEQIAYGRVWVEDDGSSVFCFGINHWQMQRLKKLMAESSEPLKVHAIVETTLSEGEFPVLTGVIEGDSKPDEEVLFIAHICHPSPGANDNASGSALILEMARAWCRLIAEGKLPRPARTIRFLWVPEWYGTIAYLHANPDWPAHLQGVICCDMVGENQQLCGGPLTLERTPDTFLSERPGGALPGTADGWRGIVLQCLGGRSVEVSGRSLWRRFGQRTLCG